MGKRRNRGRSQLLSTMTKKQKKHLRDFGEEHPFYDRSGRWEAGSGRCREARGRCGPGRAAAGCILQINLLRPLGLLSRHEVSG